MNGANEMTTAMAWIDVLGLPYQGIDATVIGQRVFVDEDTLGTMESSILGTVLFDDVTTREMADAIRSTPRDPETGLFDVTEVGGGWATWSQQLD